MKPKYNCVFVGAPMRGTCPGCGVDLAKLEASGFAGHICSEASVAERIISGRLPRTLEGADWTNYVSWIMASVDWTNFCRMWLDVAWVRFQAFERDADAEWAAEDYA